MKLLTVSHHSAKFCGLTSCGNSDTSDTAAKIVYVTLQDHIIKESGDFMKGKPSLYVPTLPKLHCVTGYVIVLVYHMILQDHMIIWSRDFMGKSHLS